MHTLVRLRSLFNPENFQGWGKTKSYFEGWYFKLLSARKDHALAVIPGIAIDAAGTGHAFIQVLDGIRKSSEYFRFPIEGFTPSRLEFNVRIGKNHFSPSAMELHLPSVSGRIEFENTVPWPKPFYSPGIMGPYAFVPFMECYHGIVSMDHTVRGKLSTGSAEMDFNDGRGYIEKDWGHSFPSAYIWLQCNHFSEPGISLKLSVARIPWIRTAFTGFIAGFWYQGRLIRFTTYTSSRLLMCKVSMKEVAIDMENRHFLLSVRAFRDKATGLASPIVGFMNGRIEESMTSEMHIEVKEKKSGNLLYAGHSHYAALEVAGKIGTITTA